jgi:alpha-beta hydrolase superfamily lysophospholipase
MSVQHAPGAASLPRFGGQRFDFTVAGRRAFMILPAGARTEGSRPWLWFQPTFLGPHPTDRAANPNANTHPDDSHAWLFTQLLARGFGVGGVEIGETYGNLEGRAGQTAFYQAVVTEFKLASRVCLLAQSRGGLMHYNWAAEHPEHIRCIGAIYPVTDIRSWVGVERVAQLGYGLPAADLLAHMDLHNPIDRLAPLAAHHVPILHVHGDQDKGNNVVDIEQNTLEFARRYRALGGDMEVIIIPGKGHQVCPEIFNEPRLPAFFLEHGAAPTD